ncbi:MULTISPECIES: glycine zipper 2TM domain-containing protein [unclassified Sphingobium]|uniref:glycine zipper 2TM domain-containing protein n=1 Tax=unclassified Sphingobium TaxID=2611147 RepID=UPI002225714C|nr:MULTISPECIES: glycine zipper 2TM domain-containing protein [unclassified Sphingobium]MCW2382811.1 hypothetical protein [Sphingobium sp. B2D3B]MCW2397016.1 hypothetical protein [Sphingobium sp. B2D3C]
MKKILLATALMALSMPMAPAMADPPHRHHNARAHDRDNGRALSHNDRVWRGNDGRYRCKRNDGTTGLLIGAGVGALAGRAVDTKGDRTVGTLLGAVGGGLLGRSIDRGEVRCR